LAESGADITTLMRAGDWESATVAKEYVDKSATSQLKIASALSSGEKKRPHEEEAETEIEQTNKKLKITSALSGGLTIHAEGSTGFNFYFNCPPPPTITNNRNQREKACFQDRWKIEEKM
jgi:hypothetical protein